MELRQYIPRDLPHLFDICLRTGDAGQDATATCSHPGLLGDYFAAPYAAHVPSMCLTLADDSGPCGYVIGAADTRAFAAWFNAQWLPRLRETYRDLQPREGATDAWLIELIRRDMDVPPCADAFPAHLHIDLLPRAQRRGWGRRMVRAWADLAAAHGALGVHLGVSASNASAMIFYERLGMERLTAKPGAVLFGLKLPAAI